MGLGIKRRIKITFRLEVIKTNIALQLDNMMEP